MPENKPAVQDSLCEVQLWGQRVGAMSEENGLIAFQYDPQFIHTGIQISPFEMPLSPRIYTHANRDPAFQGLMGVFADSLPDKFGNAVIEQYFRNKLGHTQYYLSPLQKLLYLGRRGMGALEYRPSERDDQYAHLPLQIAQLVDEARHIIQGDLHVKSADIMQVGVSAGGQYPKAVIAWNPQSNEVVAGNHDCPCGYQLWLIKFDGANGEPQEFGKLEYAYSLMASAAGIDMAPIFLLREGGRHHFMVKRFDRLDDNSKVHMTTLCGLLHRDFNIPRLLDYEDYLRATLALTHSHEEQSKAYRRMVFNVMARNQDDHSKNFSFLMGRDGRWRLSPAYDVTFACGNHFTAQHQMTVNGEAVEIKREHLMRLAEKLSISDAAACIDDVTEALQHWPEFAQQASLSAAMQKTIASAHRKL